MDLFDRKGIAPMLIGQEGEPFDSDEYVFELKLDGKTMSRFLLHYNYTKALDD